ncbi:hypothetical protein PHET_12231 [Paragonimus heterotremus]|uniref:Uncharacterized protein n=1 Tax=Paragonimus heterotremus TaxID=100268 RepID=A0A8J4WS54_9TREM|nr:hypothetical protein PHET_12231 [Paragonimus heterotremus]
MSLLFAYNDLLLRESVTLDTTVDCQLVRYYSRSCALFDFLQSCEFQESAGPLDTNEVNQTFPTGIHGCKSSPAGMFQVSDASIQHLGSFVVVPNSFDWILPCIGSIDERSKALMKIKQQRKHRAQSVRENTGTLASNSPIVVSAQSTSSLDEDILLEGIPPAEAPVLSSAPSLEEEKTALQILKQESVRWEWLRTSVRQAWHHFTHWVSNLKRCGVRLIVASLDPPSTQHYDTSAVL